MKVSSSQIIPDVKTIIPDRFEDERGWFSEQYHFPRYVEAGISFAVSQDNVSSSNRGVVRGLHWQDVPYCQAKLVRMLHGAIFDVAVDIRLNSPTYGLYVAEVLSADNGKQHYIPRGFAHGFMSLEDGSVCSFFCDAVYNAESRRGVRYDDPILNIGWPKDVGPVIVSGKDKNLPGFLDVVPLVV